MPRRSLFFLSILLILLSFTFGGNAAGEQETPEGVDEEVNLNIIMEEVPDTDVVRELIPGFEEAHPNISVEIEAMPFDSMRDRMLTSFLAGESRYDVVILDNPWVQDFADGEFLMPLDDYIDQAGQDYEFEDFTGPLREIGIVNNTTYGVPFYNYALGLIAREDLVGEAGLEPPQTLEEYMTFIEALTTDEVRGVAMQPQRGYKIFEEWKNWLYAAGGDLSDLNSESALTALELYIEAYENFAPEDSLSWAFDEALRAVSSGRAASMISYNWMLPTLNNDDGPAGDLAGDFELYEVPGGESVLGAWHWGIPHNASNPDASWAFIEYITSPEVARERVIMGGAPTRESVMSDPEVWEQGFGESYYTTVLSILENASPLATGTSAEEIIEIVGTELNTAVTGDKEPAEALQDAAEEIQDLLP